VGVLHDVRDVRRESERSLKSSKEWEDVVSVFTTYKLLIFINTFMGLDKIISYLVLKYFYFLDFQRYFWLDFHHCDLKSLSSISSMGKVARMSLDMCPQS
jgi:hypothetical protein